MPKLILFALAGYVVVQLWKAWKNYRVVKATWDELVALAAKDGESSDAERERFVALTSNLAMNAAQESARALLDWVGVIILVAFVSWVAWLFNLA